MRPIPGCRSFRLPSRLRLPIRRRRRCRRRHPGPPRAFPCARRSVGRCRDGATEARPVRSRLRRILLRRRPNLRRNCRFRPGPIQFAIRFVRSVRKTLGPTRPWRILPWIRCCPNQRIRAILPAVFPLQFRRIGPRLLLPLLPPQRRIRRRHHRNCRRMESRTRRRWSCLKGQASWHFADLPKTYHRWNSLRNRPPSQRSWGFLLWTSFPRRQFRRRLLGLLDRIRRSRKRRTSGRRCTSRSGYRSRIPRRRGVIPSQRDTSCGCRPRVSPSASRSRVWPRRLDPRWTAPHPEHGATWAGSAPSGQPDGGNERHTTPGPRTR